MGAATASLTFSLRRKGSEDRPGRWVPDQFPYLKLSPGWSQGHTAQRPACLWARPLGHRVNKWSTLWAHGPCRCRRVQGWGRGHWGEKGRVSRLPDGQEETGTHAHMDVQEAGSGSPRWDRWGDSPRPGL